MIEPRPEGAADEAPRQDDTRREHEEAHRHHGAGEARGARMRRIRLQLALEDGHERRRERALAKHAPRHVGEGERDGERALLHARADEAALEHFAHEPEHARESRENRHDGGISKNASA